MCFSLMFFLLLIKQCVSYNLHLLFLKQEPQQKVLLKLTDHHDPEKLQIMHQLYSHYHLAGDRNKW